RGPGRCGGRRGRRGPARYRGAPQQPGGARGVSARQLHRQALRRHYFGLWAGKLPAGPALPAEPAAAPGGLRAAVISSSLDFVVRARAQLASTLERPAPNAPNRGMRA
nr:hypothetical protein [Tanacetum cinerariifolium]